MKEKILKNRKLIDIIIILLVGAFLCVPLLKSNLDIYYDDGIQHIARAFGTLESINENGFFANIISSFSNGFGYSWNLFYGPLSVWGILVFKIFTSSFIGAYKLFVFVVLILSGLMMYKFALKLINNNNASLLASIFYMTFPYHLTDLYMRNALGEFVSFVFIPLVFLGLYNLFYTEDNHYYISIGAIGLILTHNISTLLVAIFSVFYCVFNLEKLKETRVKKGLIINIIFIVLATSFFWLPMLETRFSGNYEVYESGAMANAEDTHSNGLKITQLFVSRNDGSYVFELGPHIIILLCFSVMAFRRIKTELKETYLVFLVCGLITLWMSTKYFPWKFLPDELCIIQFPWRMLMMSGFFLSIVCAINIYTIVKKFSYKDVVIVSAIAIAYCLAFIPFLPIDDEIVDIGNWELGNFSGKEGEKVAGAGGGEYLPSKAHDDRFYIATRDSLTHVLEGKAVIENENKTGSNYIAKFETFEDEYTILELPFLYYPGYEIRIDGMISNSFETEKGFLGTIIGKEDTGEIEVNYVSTSLSKISEVISIITFIILGIYVWKKH